MYKLLLLVGLYDRGHGLTVEGKYSNACPVLQEANHEAEGLPQDDLLRGQSRTLCWTVYF